MGKRFDLELWKTFPYTTIGKHFTLNYWKTLSIQLLENITF